MLFRCWLVGILEQEYAPNVSTKLVRPRQCFRQLYNHHDARNHSDNSDAQIAKKTPIAFHVWIYACRTVWTDSFFYFVYDEILFVLFRHLRAPRARANPRARYSRVNVTVNNNNNNNKQTKTKKKKTEKCSIHHPLHGFTSKSETFPVGWRTVLKLNSERFETFKFNLSVSRQSTSIRFRTENWCRSYEIK